MRIKLLVAGTALTALSATCTLIPGGLFPQATTPTQAASVAPTATTTPLASTSTPASTETLPPTASATQTIPPSATAVLSPTLPATRLPSPQVVIGISVGETVTFASCSGTNPVRFTGTITTNESATVKYDWLLRGAATYNSPSQVATFDRAGTKKVISASTYDAGCGHYTISLHIISPEPMMITKIFQVP